MSSLRRFALLAPAFLGSLTLLAAAGAGTRAAMTVPAVDGLVEMVVTLPQPPLAAAIARDRALAARATTRHRLNVRAPASVSYLRSLAAAQRTLVRLGAIVVAVDRNEPSAAASALEGADVREAPE